MALPAGTGDAGWVRAFHAVVPELLADFRQHYPGVECELFVGTGAQVLKQLTDTFAREREELESGWSRGDGDTTEVSTEDVRQAIRRYRSFFNRLLSI